MSVCVFLGPTLAAADAARILDATIHPPASLGDVYRVVAQRAPSAVGIVDGYFHWTPPVWHKEILWAISQGVHVFGAASMGALRAAELAPFGMRGVGRVFEAYRDGRLPGPDEDPIEDDDEVAVMHGPKESGYRSASESMINIRCTLARAAEEGIISDGTRRRLIVEAKARFFPDRGYAPLLAQGRADGLPERELAALERWLPHGQVDQKRLDAVAMLEAMHEFLAADPPQAEPVFVFERTLYWETAEAAFRRSSAATLLAAMGLDVTTCKHLGEAELRDWYFANVAGTPAPADLEGWLRGAGYVDAGEFHRNAFSEYLRRAPASGGSP